MARTSLSPIISAGGVLFGRRRFLFLGVLMLTLVLAAGISVHRAGFADRHGAEAASAPLRSLVKAKAHFAREPNSETANAYALALLSAGRYDDLAVFLRDPATPFAGAAARKAISAEAALRRGLFADAEAATAAIRRAADGEAVEEAKAGATILADFLQARVEYAVNASARADASALLSEPLRAGGDLAREAWLFKARMALDAGELDYARLAAKRGGEAGASHDRVAAVAIEADIRQGDLSKAAAAIAVRERAEFLATRRSARDNRRVHPETARLNGLLAMREGRFRDAARAFKSMGPSLQAEPRGRLLLALAHLGAGDRASAAHAAAVYGAAAPDDWVGRDVALMVARARGDVAQASALKAELALLHPMLDRLRAAAGARRDPRAYFDIMKPLIAQQSADPSNADDNVAGMGTPPQQVIGAQRWLLGAAVLDEININPVDRRRARVLGDAREMSLYARRAAFQEVFEDPARANDEPLGPALLVLAGIGYEAAGDLVPAGGLYQKAISTAPDFAPAVLRLAALAEGAQGARSQHRDAALYAMRRYLTIDNSGHVSSDAVLIRQALARHLTHRGFKGSALLALRPIEADLTRSSGNAVDYARRLSEAGDLVRLARFTAAAVKILPDGVDKGRLHALADDHAAAARAFRAALAADPADPAAVAGYRRAMSALGRDAEARALINYIEARYRRTAASRVVSESPYAGARPMEPSQMGKLLRE
ncbi:MAG: tetratricopeptide repeat protein [Pseudomonadota bacterium]